MKIVVAAMCEGFSPVFDALVLRVVNGACAVRRPVLVLLLAIEAALAVWFVVIRHHPQWYHLAFDIDYERNVPAVFSAFQLAWISGSIFSFLFVQGMIAPPMRPLAFAAAAGFAFLGIDEYIQIHEQLSQVLSTIDWFPRLKGDVGAWIPVYALCGGLLTYAFRKPALMAFNQFPSVSKLFLAGLAMLFCGSVGCEFVAFRLLPQSFENPAYPVIAAMEEFLEMAGASVMLFAIATFGAAQMQPQPVRGQHISAMPVLKA